MRLASLLFLLLATSCSGGDTESTANDSVAATAPAPKPGSISDYSCSDDGSNLYSVYLPAGYTADKKWPVVFFFDAHGSGHLPLEKYKTIADKWGYILIGSNASKNGLPMDRSMQIGNGLLAEVKKLLPVDESNLLLCGFSGGARVAGVLATQRLDVKGVICNSAAPQGPLEGKIFVGEAGLGDMNYLEMRKYCGDAHENVNRDKKLLVFDGKHEWAPASIFEDALLLTMLWASNGNGSRDSTIVSAFEKNIAQQADSIKPVSCLLASNLLYTGATSGGGTSLVKRSGEMDRDPCVKKDEAAWKKAEEKETALQEFLSDALLTHDTTWWQQHAAEYFETKETGAEKFMRERLRGYVSLMCYTYSNQAFHMKNLHAAEKMTKVYSIVDPTNSEWAYMRAMLYMQLGMNNYVIPSLEKAIELGFNDKTRLQNDPAFAPLHSDPAFNALFGAMKQ